MGKSRTLYIRLLELQERNKFDIASFAEEIHGSKLSSLLPLAQYSLFIALLLTTKTVAFCSKAVFCYLLYLKRPLLKASDDEFVYIVRTYLRNPQIDW